MKVDRNDKRRPFRQVADDLRARVGRGEIAPGQALPSIAKLAETYGTATATIQNALGALREEGILESVPSLGYYVRDPGQTEPPAVGGQGEMGALKAQLLDLQKRVGAVEAENAGLRAAVEELRGRPLRMTQARVELAPGQQRPDTGA